MRLYGKKEGVGERKDEEDLSDALGMRKGRPQEMFCYRAEDETWGVNMEELKERQRPVVILSASQGGVTFGL